MCTLFCIYLRFLDPEGGSLIATPVVVVVVVVVVVISSLKIPKAFAAECNETLYTYTVFVLTFPTDLPSEIFS